jgi:hypothetical protein
VLVGYFSPLPVPPPSQERTAASYPDHPDHPNQGPSDGALERSETRLRPGEPLPGVPAGGAMFPPIDPAQWHEVARQEYAAGPDDEAPFATLTYERCCE